MRRSLHLASTAVLVAASATGQEPDAIHYSFDTGDATNTAVPGAGFAVGQPGQGVTFGPGGLCGDAGDPAALSDGIGGGSRIDTGWTTDLGTESWTVGCWLDMRAGAGDTNFFQYIFGDGNAGLFRAFCEGVAGDGNVSLRGTQFEVIIAGGCSDVAPTHVVWVYDEGDAEFRGYLDGVLNVTVDANSIVDVTSTGGLTFTVMGYNGSTQSMRAGTAMDDFRVYRRAIDELEIAQWVACGDDSVGTNYCAAAPNSTGAPGVISATGTDFVHVNELTLHAVGLPPNSFAFFITSRTPGFAMNPGGSAGNICVGGSVGRGVGSMIPNAGATGRVSVPTDVTQLPTPTGTIAAQAGETWYFQCWHRDVVAGAATSNFTDGLEVTFR